MSRISIVRAIAMTLLMLFSLELGARLYWRSEHKVPWTRRSGIFYAFYPNVGICRREANRPDDLRNSLFTSRVGTAKLRF